KVSPSIYVKFPLKKDHIPFFSSLDCKHLTRFTNLPVYILIWTTTPWTLPANLAIGINPNLDYVFVEIKEGFVLIAKDCLERLKEKLNYKTKKILFHCKGKELEGLIYVHPLNLREGRVLLADFVSVKEGTGCVHIAPGHGEEDYFLGLKYGLSVFSPVDDEGKFTSEVKEFQGVPVFEANKLIQRKLEEKKLLLAQEEIRHSYPHCWRCDSPLIFRAIPQWFLSVDKHQLREKAINSVSSKVKWIPPRSQARMISMLRERPDWCLSRQRYWGIGIPVVYCQSCKKAIIDERIIERIRSLVVREGSDVWFNTEVESFLPEGFCCPECGGKDFKKEEDIIDVWFESGVSHQAVVAQEKSLKDPADLYLEGSDQHRGWFQTSLLTSLSLKGRLPFKCVLTHGFVVDSQGKKMSKSLGNVIDPQKIVNSLGADTLRLWVSLEDYTEDIRISQETLNYTVEVYRRIRNTFRFLLGNLYDFSLEKDTLEPHQLREIDRYIISKLQGLVKKVTQKYENFKFYEAVHILHNFANGDLSAFYFDILKDRLYTFLADSRGRKSTQTVLFELLLTLTKLVAPVLSFTAEEVWEYLKEIEKKMEGSVFLSKWPRVREEFLDLNLEKKWDRILAVRQLSLKKLEEVRSSGEITSSLESKLIIEAPFSLISLLKSLGNELKEVFIVSQIELREAKKLEIYVEKAEGKKCQRCWNYSVYVGQNKNYPYLCERCSEVLSHLS
ncbi:isoleucine--tRNA ligase, partial [Patescibacteria group bacterium]|nr:isoleucine--tRNA ligase [Patescibacteria group bacterium]